MEFKSTENVKTKIAPKNYLEIKIPYHKTLRNLKCSMQLYAPCVQVKSDYDCRCLTRSERFGVLEISNTSNYKYTGSYICTEFWKPLNQVLIQHLVL